MQDSVSAPTLSRWLRSEKAFIAIALLLAFLFWGGRALWDTSEGRYGQVALEMLHSGNWLVPTLAGKPHLSKPPFGYWMIALGMKVFGVNAWGARFALAGFFFATILAVRELARTMKFTVEQATAAALIFASAAIPFAGGHTLTTDGFLTFWETLGVLAAWKVWAGEEHWRRLWRFVFWGAFGFAFLTKGPPGLLPWLAIALFVWIKRRESGRPALFSLAGFTVFLAFSFSWFGYMIWHHQDLFIYFVRDEVYKRVFTTAHHRNNPFWIYLPILLLGVGPWLVLWPRVFQRVWKHVRGRGRSLEDWMLFLVLWLLLPLAVFILAKSRMVFYVLPLFVPIALAMGRVLVADFLPLLARSAAWRRFGWTVGLVWLVVLLIYTAGLDMLSSKSMRPAATAFTEAVGRLSGRPELYWIWAGRQKYSIPFYMGRVIRDTDALVPAAGPASGNRHVLYITTEEALAAAGRSGRIKPGAGSLRVLARAQGYALFEVGTPRRTVGRTSEPGRSGRRT